MSVLRNPIQVPQQETHAFSDFERKQPRDRLLIFTLNDKSCVDLVSLDFEVRDDVKASVLISNMPRRDCYSKICVAIGSRIYMVQCRKVDARKVDIYNVVGGEFTEGPPLNLGVQFINLIAVGPLLFAIPLTLTRFEGEIEDDPPIKSCVLDTATDGLWDRIPGPTLPPMSSSNMYQPNFVLSATASSSKFLFISYEDDYTFVCDFTLPQKIWKRFDRPLPFKDDAYFKDDTWYGFSRDPDKRSSISAFKLLHEGTDDVSFELSAVYHFDLSVPITITEKYSDVRHMWFYPMGENLVYVFSALKSFTDGRHYIMVHAFEIDDEDRKKMPKFDGSKFSSAALVWQKLYTLDAWLVSWHFTS